MKYMLLMFLFLLACGGGKQEGPSIEKKMEPGTYLHISVKDFGEIVIKMYDEHAPNNVENIVTLTNKGFYDGLTFHRIIPGFVIQGGCPVGDGSGNPGYQIDDEISPKLSHRRGTVAMANAGPNTNGCQFYICLEPLPRLDGGYTIFGEVIQGMEVVDKIAQVPTGANDKPKDPVVMTKVWIEKH